MVATTAAGLTMPGAAATSAGRALTTAGLAVRTATSGTRLGLFDVRVAAMATILGTAAGAAEPGAAAA